MLSDASFTADEFTQKCKDFAQAVANKVPGAVVELRPDRLQGGFLITIKHEGKNQTCRLAQDRRSGQVSMTNIFGDII